MHFNFILKLQMKTEITSKINCLVQCAKFMYFNLVLRAHNVDSSCVYNCVSLGHNYWMLLIFKLFLSQLTIEADCQISLYMMKNYGYTVF